MTEECFVYVIHSEKIGAVKVGVSKTPEKRAIKLQIGSADKISLSSALRFPLREIAVKLEKGFHETQHDRRIRGEWFEITADEAHVLILVGAATLMQHWGYSLDDIHACLISTGAERGDVEYVMDCCFQKAA